MKSGSLAAGACVLALALAGCGRGPHTRFQGYVEGEFVQMAAPEAGRLDRLAVAKGDRVEAGAPLFALEAVPEAAALRQAQEQLAAAQAQFRDLQTGRRPPELEVLRAQLEQARAEARRSAADRERDAAQWAAGGVSRAQVDRSQAAAESAAARVLEWERQLEVAGLPARDDQIRAQEAQVAAAQAAVDQARWRWDQKAVSAPAAGLVFDTYYKPGEWVAAGRPVVRLLPRGNLKIRFFVPEAALGALAPGQTVRVRLDGRAGGIEAKIAFISTEAEYTPPVIYSNETRSKLVFLVEAKPREGEALNPGQPVEVVLP